MADPKNVVLATLKDLGFKRVKDYTGIRIDARPLFEGDTRVHGETMKLYVHIPSWEMSVKPSFFIAGNDNAFVPYFDPHIEREAYSSFGVKAAPKICYDGGSLLLDPLRPGGSFKYCLKLVQVFLEKLVKGELDHEPAQEFFSYWQAAKRVFAEFDFSEISGRHIGYVFERNEGSVLKLKNIPELQDKYVNKFIVYRVQGIAKPVHTVCPVDTLQDLLDWLAEVGNDQVVKQFKADLRFKSRWDRYFLFDNGCFGISLVRETSKGRAAQQRLIKNSRNVFFDRINVSKASLQHITGRNLEKIMNGLNGQNILVIGAGAIGGTLLHALVQSGAGDGGRLYICDHDEIEPGNLGRHILGRDAYNVDKAIAMKEHLKRCFPSVEVIAMNQFIESDIDELNNLDLDLIINATGSQQFSEFLNKYAYENLYRTPVLHGWIEGNGTAVCSLLVNYGQGACYRCLDVDWKSNRIPILKEEPKEIEMRACGDGPHSPYLTTAALHAAAILGEHALDAMNGRHQRKFRCLTLDERKGYILLDKSFERDPRCPVCHE